MKTQLIRTLGCFRRCIPDAVRADLLSIALLLLCLAPQHHAAAQSVPVSGWVEAEACFLRVRDKAEVPALERGVLKQMLVELGDSVTPEQTLALLDDAEVRLALEQAQLDVEIARSRHNKSLAVEIAQTALEEATGLLRQLQVESEISKRVAAADIARRLAEKDSELSQSELDRAVASKREFSSSVSDQQLVKLAMTRDQDIIRVEQANHDQLLDELRSRSKDSMVEQQKAVISRLKHELAQAQSMREVAELTIQNLQKAVAVAEQRVDRRRIKAPLNGIIVEKLKHIGEWVEAGDPVFRVIRLDQLIVEGFADARLIRQSMRGNKVVVRYSHNGKDVSVEGNVTFVSLEIDPVNQQVQIKAEIPNPQLVLNPGQSVRMSISVAPSNP